jgi:hypothetical protein
LPNNLALYWHHTYPFLLLNKDCYPWPCLRKQESFSLVLRSEFKILLQVFVICAELMIITFDCLVCPHSHSSSYVL